MDITIIIPTKDRPEKVRNTVASLAAQTVRCGRVIVVAAGRDVREHLLDLADRIDLDYVHSLQGGQIRQRNIGIGRLPAACKLVGFIDDDIVFEPAALERALDLWNSAEPETAGVGFNLTEPERERPTLLRRLARKFLPPGHVYRSGYSVPFGDLDRSIRASRLSGGATIWRREVLDEFSRPEINASWAICEDLIFSYPIGKRYPLYVCADARVLHDHIVDPAPDGPHHITRGRTWALWQLYFVTLNKDLSIPAYALTSVALSLFGMAVGVVVPAKRFYRRFYFGVASGTLAGLATLARRNDLKALLEDI